MSSPAGFPPDHYLVSWFREGKDTGECVPAWGPVPTSLSLVELHIGTTTRDLWLGVR
jgi:hypothetical protein